MRINVAIIGLGVVGKKRRLFIEKNKKYNLVAASDIRFRKDFKRKGILYFKNYDEVFKLDIKLDAIFITLPNYLSADVTIKAIKKNINVFCEKPPAKNYSELLKVKKALKSNLKLKYGFNHRYHGSIKMTKNILNQKN